MRFGDSRIAGLVFRVQDNDALWQISRKGLPQLVTCLPDAHYSNTAAYVVFAHQNVLWITGGQQPGVRRVSPEAAEGHLFQFSAWAEDDRAIYFTEQWNENNQPKSEIWSFDPVSGQAQPLTQTADVFEYDPRPWPGKPERVLYYVVPADLSVSEGLNGFLIGRMEDGREVLLTNNPVFLGDDFDPQGNQLLYGTVYGPFLWTESGEQPFDFASFTVPDRTITRVFGPVWSPDGQKVAMAAEAAEVQGVGVAVFDLSNRTGVFLRPHDNQDPLKLSWSADSQWLALVTSAFDEAESGTWLLAADGSQERQLSTYPSPAPALWSPTGQQLLYYDPDSQPDVSIWLLESPDTEPVAMDLPIADLLRWNQ